MTITVPYRGIIEITGEHDVGKTIAALQTVTNTKDIVFVDDDVKGEGTVRQMHEQGMEFDMYIDLAQERLKLGIDTPTADELLAGVVLPTIEKITAKRHKVIVWDTWRIVYQSARGHVERNKAKYKDVVDWTRGTSIMIQGLISKVARMIEVKLMNELKSSCDLLIITHHIKDNYVANVVVGKIPESSATFSEVCNMRLWLRRNQQSKVPIVLFLKRPNMPIMKKGKLTFTNIVPLKITPTNKHESIWDAIAEYEKDPIESRAPRPDETPTAEEFGVISGTLSEEQQAYIKTMIEYNKQIEKELANITEEAPEAPGSARINVIHEQEQTPSRLPTNAVQLLARAKAELQLDGEQVVELLGKKSLQDVFSNFNPIDWSILQDKAKSNGQEVKTKTKRK